MKGKKLKVLKVFGLLLALAVATLLFIGNRISKGIGDSLENGIKGGYEVSKTIDSTDRSKIDSLKEALVQEFNSVKTSRKEMSDKILCSEDGCEGIYIGPEFVDGSDIAHQFSNKMVRKVGHKLKELYANRYYCKVDFSKIEMFTDGMGTGNVTYGLKIPFEKVDKECDAYTSFDHVGGWNHVPALAKRESELKDVLMEGEKLDISRLKTTPEGLQEYWIQWKNKVNQSDCK